MTDWWGAAAEAAGVLIDLLGTKKEAEAQEETAKRNANLMQKEAEYQAWLGKQKVSDLTVYKDRLIGTQKVRFAKAGVRIDDSTALAVAADTEMQYEKDKAYLIKNAQFQVERAQAGATSFNEEAKSINTVANIQMSRTLLNFADSASKYW
jgi:hypothetical protein